jgi:hypothetical protein
MASMIQAENIFTRLYQQFLLNRDRKGVVVGVIVAYSVAAAALWGGL